MPKITYKGTLRMPAEWEPQKSTWIAWPHNKDDWPGKFDHIPFVFGKIVSELSRVQLVNILVKDKSEKNNEKVFIFNGWAFSHPTSNNLFEHPVYDVWLSKCLKV